MNFKKFIKNPITINVLLIIVVGLLLVYGTLKWLDVYTLHNQAVTVPNVKGLQVKDAELFFNNNNLKYDVVDSVYSKDTPPGAIVEIVPAAGSRVKEGRMVFLTINAFSAQTAIMPNVQDVSYRQALATLNAAGFNNIQIKYIPGQYKDLTIDVETANGRSLEVGTAYPLTTQLILLVSDGETQPEYEDSIYQPLQPVDPPTSSGDNWF